MEELSYRCIRFNLFDTYEHASIDNMVAEIKMSFFYRANCHIHSEEYKRSENNLFITIEVRGKEEAINQAINESQSVFDRASIQSNNEQWFV